MCLNSSKVIVNIFPFPAAFLLYRSYKYPAPASGVIFFLPFSAVISKNKQPQLEVFPFERAFCVTLVVPPQSHRQSHKGLPWYFSSSNSTGDSLPNFLPRRSIAFFIDSKGLTPVIRVPLKTPSRS